MKTLITLVMFLLLIVIPFVCAGEGSSVDNYNWKIKTGKQALDMALQYTGFENRYTYSTIKLIDNYDNCIPLLPDSMIPEKAWAVFFNGVQLDCESKYMAKGIPFPSRFEVYLHPEKGHLLWIRSNFVNEMYDTVESEWRSFKLKERALQASEFVSKIPEKLFSDFLIDEFGRSHITSRYFDGILVNTKLIPSDSGSIIAWVLSSGASICVDQNFEYCGRGKNVECISVVNATTGKLLRVSGKRKREPGDGYVPHP